MTQNLFKYSSTKKYSTISRVVSLTKLNPDKNFAQKLSGETFWFLCEWHGANVAVRWCEKWINIINTRIKGVSNTWNIWLNCSPFHWYVHVLWSSIMRSLAWCHVTRGNNKHMCSVITQVITYNCQWEWVNYPSNKGRFQVTTCQEAPFPCAAHRNRNSRDSGQSSVIKQKLNGFR